MSQVSRTRPTLPVDIVRERVSRFASAKVAVLGDIMLDRYFWGDVERISPEAPVPVVHVARRSRRLGGAANVAANLAALGATADVISVRGEDRAGREVVRMLERRKIVSQGLLAAAGRETTEKIRIIARHQQVVRAWRERGKPVLVDPHIPHFGWYRGATVITPNAREAHLAVGVDFRKGHDPAATAFDVVKRMELDALLVTRGEEGMSLYYSGAARREEHIPTVAKEVFDVTGAGDTVISVLAAALASGADMMEGVILANQAAGEVIKEVGTSTLSAQELVAAFE